MPLRCIDENRWRAAAKKGGTAFDLINAFSWKSATDWPCPVKIGGKRNKERDKETVHNGWGTYYDYIVRGDVYDIVRGDVYDPREVALPKKITDYIAMMYVDWKLNQ